MVYDERNNPAGKAYHTRSESVIRDAMWVDGNRRGIQENEGPSHPGALADVTFSGKNSGGGQFSWFDATLA